MPGLKSKIHLKMLASSSRRRKPDDKSIYGLEWGDPEQDWSLKLVRDQFILPYVDATQRALEIGPGGGRWTRYLLGFREVMVVDKHRELLDELAKNFSEPNLVPILNSGTDLPGVAPDSIDFAFSFGVFVHLDAWIIEAYLKALHTVVKPSGNIVIQYSDMRKKAARRQSGFSRNNPDRMRRMVDRAGFTILEENVTALWHSAIMRFRKKRAGEAMY